MKTGARLPRGLRWLGLMALGGVSLAVQAEEKIVLLTSWYAQAEQGGYYQAQATGLYKKYGLDVEIRSGGGGQQALLRGFQGGRANGMRHFNAGVFQQFKEHFGVFLFIVSRFQENGRDLLVTGFFGHTGKVGVTVAGFGLPGKRLEEIFFCFCSFDGFHKLVIWLRKRKHPNKTP